MTKVKRVLIPALALMLISLLVSCGGSQVKSQTIDQNMLAAVASETNKSCPMTVDKDTRLNNTVALPNLVFQYNYTLVNYAKADLNVGILKREMTKTLTNNVRTNPKIKIFRDNNITMAFSYSDKNGVFLFRVVVTPAQYK